MAKFCSNGHQMEDSWEICPYCQRTGYQGAGGSPQAKTRLEADAPQPAAPSPAGRKTVLLTDLHKPPVVGWFVALNGEQKGEDFRIREGQNILGSGAEAEIAVRDATVSAKHASIRYKDQKFFITDLDSTNGTYLNERPEAVAREELKDNDIIRVGSVSLKFKCL